MDSVALKLDYLHALGDSVHRRYLAGSDISSIECDKLLGEIANTAQELRSHIDDVWREARRRSMLVTSPRQPQRAIKSIDDLLF